MVGALRYVDRVIPYDQVDTTIQTVDFDILLWAPTSATQAFRPQKVVSGTRQAGDRAGAHPQHLLISDQKPAANWKGLAMKLRHLITDDAPLMLEWMHDESVVGHLATNFAEKTLDDCERFIDWSNHTDSDLHLAVTDDQDQYMGTVSLKHIQNKTAEFAITVRSCAMGKGYSAYGMKAILEKGINQLGLDAIYWCVSQKNTRAVRFYDKNGYCRTTSVPEQLLNCYSPSQLNDFIWYIYP